MAPKTLAFRTDDGAVTLRIIADKGEAGFYTGPVGHLVAGIAESGSQDRSDAAGSDHTHAQRGVGRDSALHVRTFRSSPTDHPLLRGGPVWVPDVCSFDTTSVGATAMPATASR